jgi:hypothetical protein
MTISTWSTSGVPAVATLAAELEMFGRFFVLTSLLNSLAVLTGTPATLRI